MPGSLVHVGASVLCQHGAGAMPTTSNTKVFVNGLAVLTAADVTTVLPGCPFAAGTKLQPCATIRWPAAAATKVLIGGRPAVVRVTGSGPGLCQSADQIPQGLPTVTAVQQRIIGV
ncbi:MAG TPA: hypothetical protein PJ992_00705 [Arachnia sp.]|nr:hypothetical protein [Arachnia sp.]HMR12279.1 hypothetical protein [Arachnia sp.]